MNNSQFDDVTINRRDLSSSDEIKEVKLAIPHMRVVSRSKKENINRIIDLIKEAKREQDIHIFLLPSGFVWGPLTERLMVSQNILKKVAERIPGSLTNTLIDIARKYSVYILTGALLEKAGPRHYISSVLISPFREEGVVYKYRKLNLTDSEYAYVSPGKDLGLLDFSDLRVGLLLEEDIYAPEIARVLVIAGIDLMISFSKLSRSFSNIKYIALARAIENNTSLINIGGILESSEEEIVNIKTLIIKGNGDIISESKDSSEEEIFYVSFRIKDPKRRTRKKLSNEVFKRVISYARRNKLLL